MAVQHVVDARRRRGTTSPAPGTRPTARCTGRREPVPPPTTAAGWPGPALLCNDAALAPAGRRAAGLDRDRRPARGRPASPSRPGAASTRRPTRAGAGHASPRTRSTRRPRRMTTVHRRCRRALPRGLQGRAGEPSCAAPAARRRRRGARRADRRRRRLAGEGLRVLAVAAGRWPTTAPDPLRRRPAPAGLVADRRPAARRRAATSPRRSSAAGIRLLLITGDHPATAARDRPPARHLAAPATPVAPRRRRLDRGDGRRHPGLRPDPAGAEARHHRRPAGQRPRGRDDRRRRQRRAGAAPRRHRRGHGRRHRGRPAGRRPGARRRRPGHRGRRRRRGPAHLRQHPPVPALRLSGGVGRDRW